MSTNLDDLDPDSPEYDAALEAAQAEEDAARGIAAEPKETPTAEDDARAAIEAVQADAKAKPVAAASEDDPEKLTPPSGVMGKDGKYVLPYAALQGARAEARAEREARKAAETKAAELVAEIEALKSGKATPAATEDLTEEELAELTEYAPKAAKVIASAKEAKQRIADLEKQVAAAKPAPEEPEGDPVQDAIDQVPLLAEWQAADTEKFKRAVELDAAMRTSPKWAGKPIEARFAHVAKMVADEYDIQIPDDTPRSDAATPNKADPAKIADKLNKAPRATPSTLSDFKGGAPETNLERLDKLPPARLVARMSQMTDDQIEEHLAKFG